MSKTALVITASVQQESSVTRQRVKELLQQLVHNGQVDKVIERDLSNNELELIAAAHVGAYYTPPAQRSDAQKRILAQSDVLLAELKQADILILGSPMYNFTVPASLKAWIDLVCRVGESFRYTEHGPEGLLKLATAYLVVATGGTTVNSQIDFLVPYLTQIAKFIGAKEVKVIAADKTNQQREQAVTVAQQRIAAL